MEEMKVIEKTMKETDIRIQLVSLSYGMEDINPINKVYLFNNKIPITKRQVDLHQISKLVSNDHKEIVCRLYVKQAKWVENGQKGWKQFLETYGLCESEESNLFGVSVTLSPKIDNKKKPLLLQNKIKIPIL